MLVNSILRSNDHILNCQHFLRSGFLYLLSKTNKYFFSWPYHIKRVVKISELCWVACLCANSVMSYSLQPLSMGFSWQAYWSMLPFPSPGDLPNSGIKPTVPETPASADGSLSLHCLGSPSVGLLGLWFDSWRKNWLQK